MWKFDRKLKNQKELNNFNHFEKLKIIRIYIYIANSLNLARIIIKKGY
jgi:hypothetical protein